MEYSEIRKIIKEVALHCGKFIYEAGTGQIHADTKSSFRDLVTVYDVKTQELAIEELVRAIPEAQFISEEKDNVQLRTDAPLFVIDPIDGTANFVHHFHHSCISIACILHGEPVAAVVYNPFTKELFEAVMGGGAYLNSQPIHVFKGALKESIVLFGSAPYNMELADETFQNLRSVFGRCQDVRRSGSAALDLCYVAAGRAGLFFESILSVWDYAAGGLIVREAGGSCLSFAGEPLLYDKSVKSSVIAGSASMIAESGLVYPC